MAQIAQLGKQVIEHRSRDPHEWLSGGPVVGKLVICSHQCECVEEEVKHLRGDHAQIRLSVSAQREHERVDECARPSACTAAAAREAVAFRRPVDQQQRRMTDEMFKEGRRLLLERRLRGGDEDAKDQLT